MQKFIGYVRVSTDRQDLDSQKNLILSYAQEKQIIISEFVEIEISSRRDRKDRKIDLLIEKLHSGDILLVAELSRLGRDMLTTLNIIKELTEKEVKIIFIRQPELSTNQPHGKLLLAIYSYFAESERDFISMRTVAGLGTARLKGKILGRPTGSKNLINPCSKYKDFIKKHLRSDLPLSIIHKLLAAEFDPTITYTTLRYYVNNEPDFHELLKNKVLN